MYCMNCGQKLSDDAKFCTNCGQSFANQDTPAPQPAAQQQPAQQQYAAQPQFAAPQPPIGSMPYPPQAGGMAIWPGMMISFTPEQTALLEKGWNLCRLAVLLPLVVAFITAGSSNHALQRIVGLASIVMYCVDKNYLKQVGLRMSAWYYLAIVLCPPIYLYHRENLTGKGHAWSIALGVLYALFVILVLAVLAKLAHLN
ncbi:zinc-ribbon domain-containing protein [Selenomonas sp. GACV-9]|uniref:zinc ribbon domain-containing protein n=1 Tax=Selenomonas sp. GACV-9 TaxID=3158782 RepID=UPI0008E66B54|nr:zinc-ribbon domain-containing protein [Selenomonas ruminantium]